LKIFGNTSKIPDPRFKKIKGKKIPELKSWLSKFKKSYARTAFYLQYYTKRLFFQIKKRAPSLKKLHFESFPAIHIKKMDWMDFLLKFSGELLMIIISLTVAGLNLFYFYGGNFQDQSLAANFISRHQSINPLLYAKNNSIVTVVSAQSGIIPQAQADDGLTGLGSGTTATGDADSAAGDNNSIVLSDDNSILAPNPDSIQGLMNQAVKKVYTTQAGDTLQSIAAAFGVSADSILWSNPSLTSNTLKPGWNLIIPPVNGVAVIAGNNDTLPDLAARYNPLRYSSDKTARDNSAAQLLDAIISYNGLDSAEDINPGDFLIIPGGVVATPPAAPKPPKTKSSNSAPNNSTNDVTSISSGYDDVNHLFPRGYCTYYVATQMKITFGGNAKNWLANAKASGYVTGKEAAPRSAVVMSISRYGHVAYVNSVNDDGTITISEMNYDHYNRVDTRTISVNDSSIRGYIYP